LSALSQLTVVQWLLVSIFLFSLSACKYEASDRQLLFSRSFESLAPNTPVSIRFQQTANSRLLVAVSGYEVEFEARVHEASVNILSTTLTPYLRLAPHYLVVEASEVSRELKVEVLPLHRTRNATVVVKIFDLPAWSRADDLLAEAYQLYSESIQTTDDESKDVWSSRVEKLHQAARQFDITGMEKDRLWAESLASYLTYYPLMDNTTAITQSRDLHKIANSLGYPVVALMNLHTEGQALIERQPGDSLEVSTRKQDLAQERFEQAARLAGELGFEFERSWATNNSGIGFYYSDRLEEALAKYRQALEMATALGDDFWLSLVVGNLALAKEKTGDYFDVLQIFQDLSQRYQGPGSLNQLVYNLTEVGRLHRLLYQFPEAIDIFSDALVLARESNDMESEGRVGLWLATAYFSMGYHERAQKVIDDAIKKMEATNNGRGLRSGYQLSANLARIGHEFSLMQSNRQKQGEFLSSEVNQAGYFYDKGLDALALSEGQQDVAFQYFSDAYTRHIKLETPIQKELSRLRMCSVAPTGLSVDTCSLADLRLEYEGLVNNAVPKFVIESMQVWSGILLKQGDVQEAMHVMEDMIERIRLYRSSLPGVLGAWYWESRAETFQSYLDLVIAGDIQTGEGSKSLLALDRLRNAGFSQISQKVDDAVIEANHRATNRLRELIAYREKLTRESDIEKTELEIERLLINQKQGLGENQILNLTELNEKRSRFPDNTGLLTYHFSPGGSWAWYLDQSGVKVFEISDSNELVGLINKTKENIRVVGYNYLEKDLELLGLKLVESLPIELPENIYLLPGGVLNGFPFDAIRINGKFLIEDYSFVNLQNLEGLNLADQSVNSDSTIERVFLAGNPSPGLTNTINLSSSGAELSVVAEAFPKANIFLAQAQELSRQIFESEDFSESNIIHIATHSKVDLAYPELSRIVLTSNGDNEVFLMPEDLKGKKLKAELVVLSACETTGVNTFEFDSNLGFVSEFLHSGSSSVIASLWPVSDLGASLFMKEFYSELAKHKQTGIALTNAKRKIMEIPDHNSVSDWAAFQLHKK